MEEAESATALTRRRVGNPESEPFLRWAGGKRWLLPTVAELVGGRPVDRYIEPFLGGASIFMGIAPSGQALLSDLNEDLIEVYQQVQVAPIAVASALERYENTADCYYRARLEQPKSAAARAARFVFLNHTSYNGIHRVNLKGEYNVPYGYRKSARIPTLGELEAVSRRLKKAVLTSGDFETVLDRAQSGDLVFLDPPYTVAHNNNGFVKYNQRLFSFEDQQRLAAAVGRIADLGAHFVLTNAAHESILRLFKPLGRVVTVSRRNAVGGKRAARGRADELLFTNLPHPDR